MRRRHCIIQGCHRLKDEKVSYFSLPKKSFYRKAWIKFIQEGQKFADNSGKTIFYLCSKHFTLKDFSNHGMYQMGLTSRLRLTVDAVPSIRCTIEVKPNKPIFKQIAGQVAEMGSDTDDCEENVETGTISLNEDEKLHVDAGRKCSDDSEDVISSIKRDHVKNIYVASERDHSIVTNSMHHSGKAAIEAILLEQMSQNIAPDSDIKRSKLNDNEYDFDTTNSPVDARICSSCQNSLTVEEMILKYNEQNDEKISCITSHPGFDPICLNVYALEAAFHRHAIRWGHIPLSETLEECYRYIACHSFAEWCWKRLGDDVQIHIPPCVSKKISKAFDPSVSKEIPLPEL